MNNRMSCPSDTFKRLDLTINYFADTNRIDTGATWACCQWVISWELARENLAIGLLYPIHRMDIHPVRLKIIDEIMFAWS
jgi:hypothetical protein